MCLLICIRSEDGSLVLAANRDEYYDRPAKAPFVWDRRPRVLAGQDLRSGGAWLALNEHGVVAAVTNRPTAGGEEAARPSRGTLPLLATGHASAREAELAMREHLARTRYNAFNLLVADCDHAFLVQAPGPVAQFLPVLPGRHVVGNGEWDDIADVRVQHARALLARRLEESADKPRAIAVLQGICRDHTPPAGGLPLCIHGHEAGTVSSTILYVTEVRRMDRYLHVQGPPCQGEYHGFQISDFGFQIE